MHTVSSKLVHLERVLIIHEPMYEYEYFTTPNYIVVLLHSWLDHRLVSNYDDEYVLIITSTIIVQFPSFNLSPLHENYFRVYY